MSDFGKKKKRKLKAWLCVQNTKYLLHNFACTITLMSNAITHYVSTAARTNWQALNLGFVCSLVNVFGMRRLQEWSFNLWTQAAKPSVGYASILELNSNPIAWSDIDLFPGKQWWVLNFIICSSVPVMQTASHWMIRSPLIWFNPAQVWVVH